MKSVLLLALSAQLPFAATSTGPFGGPVPQADISSTVSASEAQTRANEERLQQLFANTQSVMKVRGDASRADQVAQVNYNQTKSATQGAGGAAKGGGGVDGKAQPSAQSTNANDAARFEVDNATRSAANAAAELLATALTTPEENALDGRAVPLAEALGRVSNSSRRLEVASLYWRLALATADYHWALEESLHLSALPDSDDAVDSPLLSAAQAAAQARILEIKAAAVNAQQELADAIGQSTEPLPLTVEQPLVGPYRTEFDSIFASRPAPGRSRAIHRALPHWREAIDLRTAAVQAAASAIAPAEKAAFGQEKVGIQTVLFAHRDLAKQRRAFLNAVREYNAEIVEYASYVAGPTTSTATIVSMLTRTRPQKSSGVTPQGTFAGSNEPTVAPPEESPVRPVSGEEPVRDDQEWQRADADKAQQPM